MPIGEILSVDRCVIDVSAASKKAVLEELARMIAGDTTEITPAHVFDGLIARERLGSTGLGNGIAIPHGRSEHLTSMRGAFLRTKTTVDFDAEDGQGVDLFFALFVPQTTTQQHLEMLAKLAESFSDAGLVQQLRELESPDTIHSLLVDT